MKVWIAVWLALASVPARVDPAPAADGAARLRRDLAPAAAESHELEYESWVEADFRVLLQPDGQPSSAPAPGLVHSLALRVRGKLTRTSIGAEAALVRVAFALSDASVEITSAARVDEAVRDRMRADLSRGAIAQLDRSGRLLGAEFGKDVPQPSRDLWLAILSATQLVIPPDSGRSWEVDEEDRAGRYVARYELTETDRGPSLRKTKLRYRRVSQQAPANAPGVTEMVPRGRFVARFDRTGRDLLSLSGEETVVTSIAGKEVASARTRIRLKRAGAAPRAAGQPPPGGATDAVGVFDARSDADAEASVHRAELGGATLPELLEKLSLAEGKADSSTTPLYLKFKALIYLHPQTAAEIAPMLVRADPASIRFQILSEAAGAVGHAEAQLALVQAIRARPGNFAALSRLIPLLARVPVPGTVAEETLRAVSREDPDPNVRATATLALGTVAFNLASGSPGRADAIVTWLGSRLDQASGVAEAQQLLLALGNSGASAALPAIERHAGHSSPVIRAAAVSALRHIRSTRVEALLASALEDPDVKVRLEAARAFGYREMTPEVLRVHRKAFEREQDVDVRIALLANATAALRSHPEARAIVERAARSDPSEDVRRYAAAALDANPRPAASKRAR